MRISRYIARHSSYSRRSAEELVTSGMVSVSGQVVEDLSYRISESDEVCVDGVLLQHTAEEVWLYYKPPGPLTSKYDPGDRPTVYDSLPGWFDKFMTVGRLDRNSEGLLLFTNDGNLARYLELPSNGIIRIYDVIFGGNVVFEHFSKMLAEGLSIDGFRYRPIKVELLGRNSHCTKVRFFLSEGKNREIRRIAEYFGLHVLKLVRTGFGEFTLGTLSPNDFQRAQQNLVEFYINCAGQSHA